METVRELSMQEYAYDYPRANFEPLKEFQDEVYVLHLNNVGCSTAMLHRLIRILTPIFNVYPDFDPGQFAFDYNAEQGRPPV